MAEHHGTALDPWLGYSPEPDGPRRPASRTLSWGSTARIGVAVFVGSLLALLVFAIGLRIYVAHEIRKAGDSIGKVFDGASGGVSTACDQVLATVKGATLSATPPACAGDDEVAVAVRMLELGITSP